ncbi:MAG TPA: methyltransferase domain-containing protein [Patescibacteria group bacterium]|nr:methyltransferase domain-containing protein [Patescibacteria group bacterium]
MTDRPPCECGCANIFSSKEAEGDLRRYRRDGPASSTKALIDGLIADGVDGATLLDIGAGIGAIQLGLLAAGASRAASVDATEAYVEAARAEAVQRGFGDRVTGRVGDFVALAAEIPPADIVTLDKVVCCYGDMPALLERAAERARRAVGLVYPRETWWNRLAAGALAAWGWLTRDPTRWVLHRHADIDAVLGRAGFERHDIRRELVWQISIYRRRDVETVRSAATP